MKIIFKGGVICAGFLIVPTLMLTLAAWAFPNLDLQETYLGWLMGPGIMTAWWLVGGDNFYGPDWWHSLLFTVCPILINGSAGFVVGAFAGTVRWLMTQTSTKVCCSWCGYDLRGHALAGVLKCPECGGANRAIICRGRAERLAGADPK